jgi:hypothetical protein
VAEIIVEKHLENDHFHWNKKMTQWEKKIAKVTEQGKEAPQEWKDYSEELRFLDTNLWIRNELKQKIRFKTKFVRVGHKMEAVLIDENNKEITNKITIAKYKYKYFLSKLKGKRLAAFKKKAEAESKV